MQRVALSHETDWDGWRQAARGLVLAGHPPDRIDWTVGNDPNPAPAPVSGTFNVPRPLVMLASVAIQARQPERFGLLYSLVWRAHAGENVLADATDPDLRLARRLALAVRAEAHRMRTLMRFLPVDGGTRYLGWYAPAHFVLPANASLMTKRFPNLAFSIVTPDGSAHWEGSAHPDSTDFRFGSALRQPADDAALAAWWDQHGTAVRAEATTQSLPPDPEDLDEAPRLPDQPALGPVVLPTVTIPPPARDALACERCPLFGPAIQTVFGEGPPHATVMFVGEQAGDQEDTIGRPFVGPAGQLMDRAFEAAGIDRRTVYITNAVKHFKFVERGRRRIHQTPDVKEIEACRFWLDQESALIKPRLTVLMGGSAARALLGRPVTIGRERGRPIHLPNGQTVFVTVHPSYLLRLPDEASRTREYAAFIRDLTAVRDLMAANDVRGIIPPEPIGN
jgi:probable DNA metabolism protein